MPDREALGRLVSEITGEWVVERGLLDRKKEWDELTDDGRELYHRIGEQLWQAGFEAGADSVTHGWSLGGIT